MKNNKGFTGIELVAGLVIAGCIAFFTFAFVQIAKSGSSMNELYQKKLYDAYCIQDSRELAQDVKAGTYFYVPGEYDAEKETGTSGYLVGAVTNENDKTCAPSDFVAEFSNGYGQGNTYKAYKGNVFMRTEEGTPYYYNSSSEAEGKVLMLKVSEGDGENVINQYWCELNDDGRPVLDNNDAYPYSK